MMILVCASIATAQSDDYKKYEFYGGYSGAVAVHSIRDPRILDDPDDYNGWNTSITANFRRYAGLKFDFTGVYRLRTIPFGASPTGVNLDGALYNFAGGLQIKDNSTDKTFKPFVHVLAGIAHVRNRIKISNDACIATIPGPCPANFTERDTAVSGDIGGGIDIRVDDQFDLRILQIDYNPTRLFDTTHRRLRVGIGIVFH